MPENAVPSRRTVAALASLAMVAMSAIVLVSGPSPTADAAVAPGSTVRASVHNEGRPDFSSASDQELAAGGSAVVFTSRDERDPLSAFENRNVYVRDLISNRTILVSRGQFTRPEPPTTTTTTTTTFDPPDGPVVKFGSAPLLDLGAVAQQTDPPPPVVPGETPANGDSSDPTISADGRYVAFVTEATNIVESKDDEFYQDILVCDRDPDGDGTFDENKRDDPTFEGTDRPDELAYTYFRITRPDDDGDGGRLDEPSEPSLSADAGRIVWQDYIDVPNGDGSDLRPRLKTAVLRTPDGQFGAPSVINPVPAELEGLRLIEQFDPAISADGNHILMSASYRVPCPPTGSSCPSQRIRAIVTTDMRSFQPTSTRVDVEAGGGAFVGTKETILVMRPAVSADGSVVAFEAEQQICDDGCFSPRQPNVYVVHLDASSQPVDSVIASKNTAGELVNGFAPGLSADGRYLAFVTDALNTHDGVDYGTVDDNCLVSGGVDLRHEPMLNLAGIPPRSDERDIRTICQVVVRDLVLDQERLIDEQPRLPGTLASPGRDRNCSEGLGADDSCAGNGDSVPSRGSTAPSLSTDGDRVAYDSFARDLVPDDTNQSTDVFVRIFKPTLQANPNPLEFGSVTLGESASRTTVLNHVGAGPLVVLDITIEGANAGDFELAAETCTGRAVHQLESCLAGVLFTPEGTGDRLAQLVIRVRGIDQLFTVDLRGSGSAQPVPPGPAAFAAGPNPVDFGPRLLLSQGPASVVTVTNTGGSPLRITNVSIEPAVAPAEFAVVPGNTCVVADLLPGRQCTVSVTFSPALPGNRAAALRFDDNAAGSPHLVGLRGQAGEPVIELNPGVTPPGRVTSVTGAGFPPGRTVTVRFLEAVGTATATVGQDGTFLASLLIFPKATVGTRTVVATVDAVAPEISADKPLLVVSATVGPAEFVVRG